MSKISLNDVWAKLTSESTVTVVNVFDTPSTLDNTADVISSRTHSVDSSRSSNLQDLIRELAARDSDPRCLPEMETFLMLSEPFRQTEGDLYENSFKMMADAGIRKACKDMIKAYPDVFDYELRKIGLTSFIFKSIVQLLGLLHDRTDDIDLPDLDALYGYHLFKRCTWIILHICSNMCTTYLTSPDDLEESESRSLYPKLNKLLCSEIISFLLDLVEPEATTDLIDAAKVSLEVAEFPEDIPSAKYSVVHAFHATVQKEFLQLKEDRGPELLRDFEALVRDVNEKWEKVTKAQTERRRKERKKEGTSKAMTAADENAKVALVEFAFESAYFIATVRSARGKSESTGLLTVEQKKDFEQLPHSLKQVQETWETIQRLNP